MEQFEKASRLQIRFNTTSGLLTTEDLWTLPLTTRNGRANLDDIAKGLYKQLKEDNVESFVTKSEGSDETTQLKFDIVKHIIGVRLEEIDKAKTKQISAEKKQRILEIIAHKETEELSGSSLDELRAMAESL